MWPMLGSNASTLIRTSTEHVAILAHECCYSVQSHLLSIRQFDSPRRHSRCRRVTYINIESQDRILLAVPLESRDLGLELVVLLLSLRPRPMVSLGLLALGRSLLLGLLWLLRLRRILGSYWRVL